MPRIHIADPAWHTTFPFRVAPLPNEWIAAYCCAAMRRISGEAEPRLDTSCALRVREQR